MARVTVEDCVGMVPNRFELVLLAAQRARDIRSGAELTVERDNDKNAVVALREIAEEAIDLRNASVTSSSMGGKSIPRSTSRTKTPWRCWRPRLPGPA